ncbi:MAG: helix-turn-helix transcriptional regulator [Cyclobacteriaceae bacterium]
MQTITIQIKNMVCPRCIHVVKEILSNMDVPFTEIDLGYATLKTENFPDFDLIDQKLQALDLGLVRDQNEVLVTEINRSVLYYLENISSLSRKQKLSDYISLELARNYHQLSKIYRKYTSNTIEQYFIELRTNKVKTLIKLGDLNLSQIAITVGYSSIHYLSGQFKKYTGMSLSDYRKNWEDEVRRSFERQTSLEPQPERGNCKCGCEDCHCAVGHTEHKKQEELMWPLPKSNSGSMGKLNPLPNSFREYWAFVSL